MGDIHYKSMRGIPYIWTQGIFSIPEVLTDIIKKRINNTGK